MGYTLEITDGATTYAFQVQPKFDRSFDYEDDGRIPPNLTAEIETWSLKGAFYTGAEAAVTSDFEALRALLADRLTPVTSAAFKRDGATVFELNRATSHKGGVLAKALGTTGDLGQWATYWQGDLVLVGRRILADGDGIVRLEKTLAYAYDAAGLTTVRLSGRVTTIPGTSAESKARAQALTSPGAAFGLATQGPNGEPNVTVEDPDDTRASFDSTWREHGVALPAGVNEWTLTQEVHDGPEGEVVTTTVRAKGPTAAALKTAVRAKKPGSALTDAQEAEDKTGREYSATYVQERATATTADRLGSAKLISRRVEIAIDGSSPEGDERDLTVDLIPGYDPWFTKNPRGAITVTERIVARLRGAWSSLAEFRLEPQVGSIDGMQRQPGGQRGPSIVLESAGITRDADVWRGEASYVYLAAKADVEVIVAIAGGQ